jgi:hypothetical protein
MRLDDVAGGLLMSLLLPESGARHEFCCCSIIHLVQSSQYIGSQSPRSLFTKAEITPKICVCSILHWSNLHEKTCITL